MEEWQQGFAQVREMHLLKASVTEAKGHRGRRLDRGCVAEFLIPTGLCSVRLQRLTVSTGKAEVNYPQGRAQSCTALQGRNINMPW